MANTKIKGDTAEIAVMYAFQRAGYYPSIPFGDNAPYDLIVESPTKRVYRIQIRWVTWRKDVLAIRLRSRHYSKNETIDLDRVDGFAVFDGKDVYLIPRAFIAGRRNALYLRRGQLVRQNSNPAGDFRAAFHMFP